MGADYRVERHRHVPESRAIGPTHDRSMRPDGGGPLGTRPWLVLIPDSPHNAEGMRIEPPPSEPVPIGTMPAAMAAPYPPTTRPESVRDSRD